MNSASALLCAVLGVCLAIPSQAQVRRAETIAIAEAYLNFRWKPSAANAFHGRDSAGIQVDTPDADFKHPGIRPGWWKSGAVNIGMPYQWGGFSTPADFTAGLKHGRFAGDVYTSEKRRMNDAAVSKQAIGIDCSGLVSRCWKLDRPYDTAELPTLCAALPSFDALQPGDILNSPNNHVLLFESFTDAKKQRLLAYEAGSPPTWKVLLNSIPVAMLREQNYQPFRFHGMRD